MQPAASSSGAHPPNEPNERSWLVSSRNLIQKLWKIWDDFQFLSILLKLLDLILYSHFWSGNNRLTAYRQSKKMTCWSNNQLQFVTKRPTRCKSSITYIYSTFCADIAWVHFSLQWLCYFFFVNWLSILFNVMYFKKMFRNNILFNAM